MELATGAVTTLAGSGEKGVTDGASGVAQLQSPFAVSPSRDGTAVLLVATTHSGDRRLRRVCVGRPAPPPPLAVPPSSFGTDMGKVYGDETLPQGAVTFLIGPWEKRLAHVTKAVLCVRSEYFRTMFSAHMLERDAAEVAVPDADHASFSALVHYLCTDTVDLGDDDDAAYRAMALMVLARKYQVRRLEMLCARALQERVGPANAVPLLEAACATEDDWLFTQCRRLVAERISAVRASGGVEQLRDLGVAKGLLGDAIDQVAQLKGQVTQLQTAVTELRGSQP